MFAQSEQTGKSRKQNECTNHVPEEHKGEKEAHIGLKFDGGVNPGCHTNRKGKTREGHGCPTRFQRFKIGLL